MGRNNKQRRAEKKRRSRPGPSERPRVNNGDVAWCLHAGALAAARGDDEAVRAAAEVITARARTATTGFVGTALAQLLAVRFDDGWQPAELVRMSRRRGARHAAVVVAALAAPECWDDASGAPMPEVWAAQLQALEVPAAARPGQDWLAAWMGPHGTVVDEMVLVLEVLGVLLGLAPIEALLPRPRQWSSSAAGGGRTAGDDPVLAKIRALLAKAESTGFEAEAEALTAKAQELMARHAIDGALARAGSDRREPPITRRVAVDDPYAAAKSQLLAVVARANDVRCVWYEGYGMMAIIGFAADLDAVEVLFTSLLVQAGRAMAAKGQVRDGRGRSRTRSFRQSFIVAFAVRIGERLTLAAAAARRQAEEETSSSLAPVLASRAQEIDDAVAKVFPHTRPVGGPSVTNEDGWRAGRIAAELATLGAQQGMLDGMVAAG